MGLSWKWSISEVFLQIIVGGLGPFPMGSMELTTLEHFFLEASMYGEAWQPLVAESECRYQSVKKLLNRYRRNILWEGGTIGP